MYKKISVAVFIAIILLVPVLSFLSPYKTFSEQENRILTGFPQFSFDEFTSRRFMNGFDSFVSDHIALRDSWITVKAQLSTLIGKRDNKNIYLGKDCLIQDIAKPNPAVYKANTQAIDDFIKSSKKPGYLLIAPTAAEIERSRLPDFATTWNQFAFISSIGAQLQSAHLVNITSALSAHQNEYIYYRTDHHWTSLGAYYAYQALSKPLHYKPLDKSSFSVEHATDAFNGTLYSKSGYRSVTPDTIDFYHYKSDQTVSKLTIGTGKEALVSKTIYFRDYLAKKDKYSAFFDNNQPVETLYTKNQNGKKLLVFKDSYAHSLVPFLMNHYSQITMIDLRYLNDDLKNVVKLKDFDQILFVYNADTFNTDPTIQTLDYNEP